MAMRIGEMVVVVRTVDSDFRLNSQNETLF